MAMSSPSTTPTSKVLCKELRSFVAVENAGEAARMVVAERELLENTEAGPVAPTGAHHLLDVDVPRLDVVELFDLVLLGADRELAVPVAVSPFRMRVAETAHPERQQRLELDAFLAAVVTEQAQRRAFGAPQPLGPTHFVHRCREVVDTRLGVGAEHGFALPDEVEHRLAADEAIAVRTFEAQEVRAAVVPVD